VLPLRGKPRSRARIGRLANSHDPPRKIIWVATCSNTLASNPPIRPHARGSTEGGSPHPTLRATLSRGRGEGKLVLPLTFPL
jgi:hypothetical protein